MVPKMIKSITKLQNEKPELFKAVYQRLCNHPSYPDMCRFTFAELQQLAGSQNKYLMKYGDSQFVEYQRQFTRFELTVMDQLLRVSEDRLDRIKRRVATAVEKTTRYLLDLKEVHRAEEKLRQDYEALQSVRSRVGMPALDERFT